MRSAALTLSLLLATLPASAADMRSIDVTFDGTVYKLRSVVWFSTGIDETYAVFSRWDYSTRFSSAVAEARDTEIDGTPGYYVVNRGCILFFCKSLTREGRVEREPNHQMRAFADPEKSDFRQADEVWEFSEEAGGTRVVYRLTMEPGFWVPPAIGPWMIKRKLLKDGASAIDRIEEVAREYAAKPGLDLD
ncbi:MAG: hypothetical protein QNJ14_12785 [Woeseiaceae bacterium]|nr:hypothetical protein [Woeseiaceae bacterium]